MITLYEKKSSSRANRKKIHLIASIVLFILNIALILPLAIMVVRQKPVNLTLIPAIAMAAYTTYKVIMASINLKRRKKKQHSGKAFALHKLYRCACFCNYFAEHTDHGDVCRPRPERVYSGCHNQRPNLAVDPVYHSLFIHSGLYFFC
ncbi:MAG: hypothetical protein IKN57_14205 [Parasporobacterium sp.]|nr:hypothetical protein [Parasporobacterium sp.]